MTLNAKHENKSNVRNTTPAHQIAGKAIGTFLALFLLAWSTAAQAAETPKTTPTPSPAAAVTTATAATATSATLATSAASTSSTVKTSATLATASTTETITTTPDEKEKKDEDDGLMDLNLKEIKIDQLTQFISKYTNKPVIRNKAVNATLTINSPKKVTIYEALDLIYDNLRMEGFVVIESKDKIQLLPIDKVQPSDIELYSGTLPLEVARQKSRFIRRVLTLNSIPASTIKMQLEPYFQRPASIQIDDRTGKVIITDTVRNIERYKEIIDEFDTIGFDELEIKIVPILNAEPAELLETMQQFLRSSSHSLRPGGSSSYSREGRSLSSDDNSRIVLLPLPRNSALLVGAPKEKFASVVAMIKELDMPIPQDVDIRVLEYDGGQDANDVARAIMQLFPSTYRSPEKDRVQVMFTDYDEGALLIKSSAENFEKIKEICANINKKPNDKIKIHLVDFQGSSSVGDISDVARAITQMFPYRSHMRPEDAVSAFATDQEGSLLVRCSDENYEIIKDLIDQMTAIKDTGLKIHIIELKHAETYTISSAIEDMFPSYRRNQSPDEIVNIIQDDIEGIIVVSASDKNFEKITELVEKIDTERSQKSETRTYKLEYVDAVDTAQELGDLYSSIRTNPWEISSYYGSSSRRGGGRGSNEARFIPVTRTNALMVTGPPSEFELIEELLADIDKPMDKIDVLPRIYTITNGDASEVVDTLNTIFGNSTTSRFSNYDPWRSNSRASTGVSRLSGKIQFSADTNTNSIIAITNNKENYIVVDDVIKEIDRPTPELANTTLITLEHAVAAEVATALNSLFGRPSQARPQGNQPNNQPNNGNNNNNSGSSREIVLQSNDYSGASFNGWWGDTRTNANERPISNLIGQVRIVPDQRTNSLLVTAASHNLSIITDLISDLDKEEPQVLIAARLVEINRGNEEKKGLRWSPDPSTFSKEELDGAFRAMGSLDLTDEFTFGGLPNIPGNNPTETGSGIIGANVNMTLLLQLIEKNLSSDIRSKTEIYVSNNKLGRIFAGDSIQRVKGTNTTPQGGISDILESLDVGVTLEIIPHVNETGIVVMTIYMQSEQLMANNNIQTREYNTEIALESGATAVMGGITLESEEIVERVVPVLGHIPVVGRIFRHKDSNLIKNDVYVFITPTVTTSKEEILNIVEETETRLEKKSPTNKEADDK